MTDSSLFPGRLLRRVAMPASYPGFAGVQIDDARFGEIVAPDTPLLVLYEGAIHAEGPAWQASHSRLLFSDVSNRRLNAWYEAGGRVEVVIDATWFINGNAVAPDGRIWHCEHGRRCISVSHPELGGQPEPVVTQFEGKRLNSPNDVAVAPDGAIWFTDPIFGIVMPSQGALAEPELDHRSVYRYDPESGVLARTADFEQPNGVALSPDGHTLYVSDTSISLGEVPGFEPGTKHEIQAFALDPHGTANARRLFCHADHGYPDGFAIDRRGWLWTSADDGVHIWSPEREKLGFIPVPTTVSNLCFGGSDNRRLFIAASDRVFAIDLAQPAI